MKTIAYLTLVPVAGLLALTACTTTPQMTNRPDFLTTYSHLQKVDATTWRYVSPVLLGQCKKFIVSPVKVAFTQYKGQPIPAEQRQRAADFVRQTFAQALSARYQVVSDPGPDVGEIRIAMTEAYATAGKLGLCVQAEVLDNSNTQVAAVVRTELSELYVPDWENKPVAREMVQAWAQRLIKVLDEAQGK
jgi:hypothetical protein